MIDEKKEEFKLPDNMKIWCGNREYGARVQEKLLSLGCSWCGSGTRIWHPETMYALYVRNNKLTWGGRLCFEENTNIVGYILDETTGEIIPADKETQEDKSATEVATDNNETESLDSLFNQIVLLQKENDSLVEQKEQLVNKISANTQAINILKDKMQQYLNQIGNVFVGVGQGGSQVSSSDAVTYRDLKVGDTVRIYDDIREVVEITNDYDGYHICKVQRPYYNPNETCLNSGFDSTDKWKFVSRPNK